MPDQTRRPGKSKGVLRRILLSRAREIEERLDGVVDETKLARKSRMKAAKLIATNSKYIYNESRAIDKEIDRMGRNWTKYIGYLGVSVAVGLIGYALLDSPFWQQLIASEAQNPYSGVGLVVVMGIAALIVYLLTRGRR